MKFIASKNELLSNLQALIKVVPTRATIPAIENFLFEISGNVLKITATDIETTLTTKMDLELVEGNGKVSVGARKLMDILKEFPEQPLTFEFNLDNQEFNIITESGKYTLPTFDGEDFPTPAELDENETTEFSIPADVLYRSISKTFFAIGEDELRPQLTGIFIQLKSDGLTFVSTDAHKLVRFKRMDFTFEEESSFILPKKPAELIRTITAKIEDDIIIKFDKKNVIFQLPNFTLSARLIAGQYPDYEAIIPINNDKKVDIDRESLLGTIRRVSLFANEASKLVKFKFENDSVEISAQDIDFSTSAYEKLPCRYEGQPIEIGFKSTFLIEILSNLEAAQVTISMSNPEQAALVYPTVPEYEEEDELMLVMPLSL